MHFFKHFFIIVLGSITLWAVPDLSLSISDNPDPVFVDSNVTYTISISNGNIEAASDVSLDITFNSGLTYTGSYSSSSDWSCSGTSPVTCNYIGGTGAGGTTLAKNTTEVLTLTATAPGSAITASIDVNASSSDGGDSDLREYTTVTTNIGPTAYNKYYTTNEDTPFTGNIITDSPATYDPNDTGLTLYSVTCDSNTHTTFPVTCTTSVHGTLTVSSDGSFTYDPSTSYTGQMTFQYVVQDNHDVNESLQSNEESVTIEVLPTINSQCESFPTALNVFYNYGVINVGTGNHIDTPDRNLSVTNSSSYLIQGDSITCYDSNQSLGNDSCVGNSRETRALVTGGYYSRVTNTPRNVAVTATAEFTNHNAEAAGGCSTNYNCNEFTSITAATGTTLTFHYNAHDIPAPSTDTYNSYRIEELTLGNDVTLYLEPGRYYIDEFTAGTGLNIKVIGEGDGSASARLYLYDYATAVGSMSIPYGSDIGNAGDPSRLVIISMYNTISINDAPTASDGTLVNAYLYSGSGAVNLGNYSTLNGAATANNIYLGNNVDVHYAKPALDDNLNNCFAGGFYAGYSLEGYGPFVAYDAGLSDSDTSSYDIIKTKVAAKTFDFQVTHLGEDQTKQEYVGQNTLGDIGFAGIYVTVVDSESYCEDPYSPFDPTKGDLDPDTITGVFDYARFRFQDGDETQSFIADINNAGASIAEARRKLYLKMTTIDFGKVTEEWGAVAGPCTQNSSTEGNLAGLPQCFNSIENIILAGYGHCKDQCDSNDPVAKAGGCYACIAGVAGISFCGDAFANRPASYSMKLNATDTDKMRAGVDYQLDINATQYGSDTNTSGYNAVLDNVPTDGDAYTLFAPKMATCDIDHNQTFTAAFDAYGKETVNPYNYYEVGDVNITLVDTNWTKVDQDEGECVADSNSTDDATGIGCLIKNIKPVRFVPFGFDINATLNDANKDGNFTYLSNYLDNPGYHPDLDSIELDRNMSAQLDINITAVNEAGGTTTHYNAKCYAMDSDITFNLNVGDSIHPIAPAENLSKMLVYDVAEEHDTNGTVPFPATYPAQPYFTFSPVIENNSSVFTTDDNGTTHMQWRLNFDRNNTKPVNPFQLDVNNIFFEDNDSVSGSEIVDDTATFYYGRMHAPRYRINGNTGALDIYFEVYSDNADDLVANVSPGYLLSVDDIHWYQNTKHHLYNDQEDGTSIREYIPKNASRLNDFDGLTNNFVYFDQVPFTYKGNKGYPYKATIKIVPNSWLLYHRFNPSLDYNEFELEFNRAGEAAGKKRSTIGVDSNASANTNRRIEW